MFVALDKTSNDLVAIRKVKMVMNDSDMDGEARLLKESRSRFIVRYYDVLRREGDCGYVIS